MKHGRLAASALLLCLTLFEARADLDVTVLPGLPPELVTWPDRSRNATEVPRWRSPGWQPSKQIDRIRNDSAGAD